MPATAWGLPCSRTSNCVAFTPGIALPSGPIRVRVSATSGHALLYDARSRLEFSGGITVARGHAGDNVGRSAIEALIAGDVTVLRQAPVFGCALHNPATMSTGTEGAWKR